MKCLEMQNKESRGGHDKPLLCCTVTKAYNLHAFLKG